MQLFGFSTPVSEESSSLLCLLVLERYSCTAHVVVTLFTELVVIEAWKPSTLRRANLSSASVFPLFTAYTFILPPFRFMYISHN